MPSGWWSETGRVRPLPGRYSPNPQRADHLRELNPIAPEPFSWLGFLVADANGVGRAFSSTKCRGHDRGLPTTIRGPTASREPPPPCLSLLEAILRDELSEVLHASLGGHVETW